MPRFLHNSVLFSHKAATGRYTSTFQFCLTDLKLIENKNVLSGQITHLKAFRIPSEKGSTLKKKKKKKKKKKEFVPFANGVGPDQLASALDLHCLS